MKEPRVLDPDWDELPAWQLGGELIKPPRPASHRPIEHNRRTTK